jgi:hypothetical protein
MLATIIRQFELLTIWSNSSIQRAAGSMSPPAAYRMGLQTDAHPLSLRAFNGKNDVQLRFTHR